MDLSFVLNLSIKLIVGCVTLLTAAYFLGKTQLSQITLFDFISALILGELLGNGIYDKDINLLYVLYTIFAWSILMFIIKYITQKFKKSRSFLEGNPSIVIKNGEIDYNQLDKNKLDINELQSLLREKDVFSIREVEYAILEPSGSISVLKKSKYNNPTGDDLGLAEKPVYLPKALIIDGEVLLDNLKSCGFDEEWLQKQLHIKAMDEVKNILYAEWKQDEGLFVVPYKNRK